MRWILPLILLLTSCNNYANSQEKHKVVILDSGLDLSDDRFQDVLCGDGHKDFTGEGLVDLNYHGTHIAGLIKKYAEKSNYCLIIVKYFTAKKDNSNPYIKALKYIETLNPDVVNISGGGEDRIPTEFQVIANNPRITFIVAAGNDNKPVDFYCPACYNGLMNLHVVGALNGKFKADFSNFAPGLFWEQGVNIESTIPNGKTAKWSGSSMATAIHTGKFIRANFK